MPTSTGSDRPARLVELGLEDAFDSAICLVEWADRLGPALPARRLMLGFDFLPGDAEGRLVRLEAVGRRLGLAAGCAGVTRAAEIGDFLAREGWGWAERDAAGRRRLGAALRAAAAGILAGAILMDMAPESGLDVRPFLAVTAWLRAGRLSAPEVLGGGLPARAGAAGGFGRRPFRDALRRAAGASAGLYAAAVDLLADLQRRPPPGDDVGWTPPPYDMAFLMREARLAVEWYLPAATGAAVPDEVAAEYEALTAAAFAPLAVAAVPVLRDYHAENLIWLPRRTGHARVGMLDYQDMLIGHPAYDLVSLLEDARRDYRRGAAGGDAEALSGPERGLPRDIHFGRQCAVCATQSEDPRALHPALPAGRQAAVSGISAAGLGASGAGSERSGAGGAGGVRGAAGAGAGAGRAGADRGGGMTPRAVMIFAAGLGTRMGALTRDRPKPLIEVAGRPLIDHALALVRDAGIARVVVNAHAHAGQLRAHLARVAPDALVSDEPRAAGDRRRAERGAAAARAGAGLHAERGHGLGGANPLRALGAAWSGTGGLLFLVPRAAAVGHGGPGDFVLDAGGLVRRRGAAAAADFVYTGAGIIEPGRLAGFPGEVFSLNPVWDAMIAEGQLPRRRAFGRLGRRRPARGARAGRGAHRVTRIFAPSAGPRVFALAPGVDFSRALVAGLDARLAGQPPEAIARVTIWVPTRRCGAGADRALCRGAGAAAAAPPRSSRRSPRTRWGRWISGRRCRRCAAGWSWRG